MQNLEAVFLILNMDHKHIFYSYFSIFYMTDRPTDQMNYWINASKEIIQNFQPSIFNSIQEIHRDIQIDGWTDRLTDGRTDRHVDGRTDGLF